MTVQGLCIPSNQKAHGQGRPPTRDACSPRATAAYSLDIPVFAVIGACKAAVAQCESSHELQLVLKSYSGSIREQGWTVLITECGKRGELEKAQQVFGAVPNKNVWHFSALITAMGACGQWRAALELLEHLTQLSLKDRQLQPNHVTYSAAIVACARGGRTDHVQRLFEAMVTAGLEPDSVTYYIVLSTCSRLGAWGMVDKVLQTMHAQGHGARATVYQTYIRHLCRTSQVERAMTVFLSMQELEVPVTNEIVSELLSALNRCGKPNTAACLLMQAAEADLVQAGCVCEATYSALSCAGCEDQAQQLREYVAGCKEWRTAAAAGGVQAHKLVTGQDLRVPQPKKLQSPERETSACGHGSPVSKWQQQQKQQQQQQSYYQRSQQFDSQQQQQQLAQQYVQAMAWPCIPMPMHWLHGWGTLPPLPPPPASACMHQTGEGHYLSLSPQHPVQNSSKYMLSLPGPTGTGSRRWSWSPRHPSCAMSTSSSEAARSESTSC